MAEKANEDDLGTLASSKHSKHHEGAQYEDDEDELMADLDQGHRITDSENESAESDNEDGNRTGGEEVTAKKKEFSSPYLFSHSLDEKTRALYIELHLPGIYYLLPLCHRWFDLMIAIC